MKEFWSIVRCFIGLHRWTCRNASSIGEHNYNGHYHVPCSSICLCCVRCGKMKFKIIPGSWTTPTKEDSEIEQLKKMTGIQ